MNILTYAQQARRTQNPKLTKAESALHSIFGMVAELGEMCSVFQHYYQGEPVILKKLEKELGDLMWFIIEFCDMYGIDPSHMLRENIAKLKKRYPEGFSAERSAHRHEIEE